MLTLSSVPPGEAAPFYKDYLAAFPDGRVGIHLQAQVVELDELCAGLSESGAMFRYAATYAPEGQFSLRSVEELVSEFKLQRASTLALVNGIPPAAWPRVGTANGFRTSARALVYIILGHTAHHCRLLRERYRLPAAP